MLENGKRPHITVVGDLILDRYLIGDATKLNPEQPGVVIRVDKEEDRLGGAAAVAMIAAGLGACFLDSRLLFKYHTLECPH